MKFKYPRERPLHFYARRTTCHAARAQPGRPSDHSSGADGLVRHPSRGDASCGLQLGLETLAARLKCLSRILLEHLGRLDTQSRKSEASRVSKQVQMRADGH